MSDVDYKLQGMNGGRKVVDGAEFAVNAVGNGSQSRGFQVTVAGTFTYTMLQAYGVTSAAVDSYSSDYLAGQFIGGPITQVAPINGGEVTVFPSGPDFTIT